MIRLRGTSTEKQYLSQNFKKQGWNFTNWIQTEINLKLRQLWIEGSNQTYVKQQYTK